MATRRFLRLVYLPFIHVPSPLTCNLFSLSVPIWRKHLLSKWRKFWWCPACGLIFCVVCRFPSSHPSSSPLLLPSSPPPPILHPWRMSNLPTTTLSSSRAYCQQWYYFGMSNIRKGVTYHFRIVNFYKRSSMYNRGLRPLLYSQKTEQVLRGIQMFFTGVTMPRVATYLCGVGAVVWHVNLLECAHWHTRMLEPARQARLAQIRVRCSLQEKWLHVLQTQLDLRSQLLFTLL